MSKFKKSLENFFVQRVSRAFHKSLKSVGNIKKEAINADLIDVRISCESNYSNPTTKSCSYIIPVFGHTRSQALIMWEIGARKTNQDQGFCYRHDCLFRPDYETSWQKL